MATTDVRSMVLSKLSEHALVCTDKLELTLQQQLSEIELDSLAILEVIYDLEDYYSITVDSSKLHSLTTVGDLISIVNNSMANAA